MTQALEVVCRSCHLARHHHQPDPARLAWVRFLNSKEFSAC